MLEWRYSKRLLWELKARPGKRAMQRQRVFRMQAAALTEEDLSKLRAAEAKDWHAAASSAEALGRLRSCLVAHIFHGAPQLRALGACAYLAALGNSAAPTAALLDDVALHGVLRVCREAARALDRASGPEVGAATR